MGARSFIHRSIFILLGLFAVYFTPASGIECYQCSSTNNSFIFQCNEFLTNDIDIKPTSCDNVFGARHCIKYVGRFEVLGLECYQCTSADDWKCESSILTLEALTPKSCDHVHGAQHCIKTTGRYGGGVGTKRLCSSVDMGNYCHYDLSQPGDELKYRTCVYTCSTDGCNPAPRITPPTIIIGITLLLYYLLQR